MKVLFLVEQFSDEPRDTYCAYPGGAEQTDAALIESCPWTVTAVRAVDMDPGKLSSYDIHVLGSLGHVSSALLREISRLGRHVLFEHDVRICRYRGNFPVAKEPVHRLYQRCICPHFAWQRVYRSARGVIYLTSRQQRVFRNNPFYYRGRELILGGSAMNREFFRRVRRLQNSTQRGEKTGQTCILDSDHPIKGTDAARTYCRELGIEPVGIRNMTPHQVLDLLENSSRFVYLPLALEPAGRMPAEARFLDNEVIVNGHVGVASESWWQLENKQALAFFYKIPQRFWDLVESLSRV